jgi:phosphoglycerate dehydrogenase-like enzyme
MRVVLADATEAEELAFLRDQSPTLDLVAPTVGQPLEPLLPDAAVIVTKRVPIDESLIAGAGPSLRLIQAWSSRPDRIDLTAAARHGIPVAVMPLQGCIAVAECSLMLMLGLSKKIVAAHTATVGGAYRARSIEPIVTDQQRHKFQWMELPGLFELNGRRLGLVGFGEIAVEVARRARAFGMHVSYWSRRRASPAAEAAEGVTWRSFDELLSTADFVSLHVPFSLQTERLIDAAALARMRPRAFLINTCRGGVVDETALVAALERGAIAGAGLDVYVREPIPADHPLLRAPNVLLLPHIGGGSGGARVKHARDVLGNVAAFLSGRPAGHLLHRVT